MKRVVTYNGFSNEDIDVIVSSDDTYNSASPSYNSTAVNGRNGNIITLNNRRDNLSLTYKYAFRNCGDELDSRVQKLKQALYDSFGKYYQLTDSYRKDGFRMAMWNGEFEFTPFRNRRGSVEVTFTCKPDFYLHTGQIAYEFRSGQTVTMTNPSVIPSKPLIRVYGTGSLKIGSNTITVAEGATSYVDIDCELEDSYEDLVSRSNLVTITGNYPTFDKGTTSITYDSTITRILITPRWVNV